ncbi:MAG: ATP-binding protein [Candidatus Margulisiibacteriota bacterium]
MTQTQHIHLTIPAMSDYVGVVRLALSGLASRMNFTVEEIEDIKIAVSEACTNAVQHAYEAHEGRIDIDCYCHEDRLEIVVKDQGKGFNMSSLGTPEQKQASEEKLGLGLGLAFIQSLMSEASIESEPGKGTTVRISKTLTPVT